MNVYPEMFESLPEIDTPLPGIRGRLLQGENNQVVFFDIEKGAQVPPHSHCAQWGLMIDGEMALTIGGETAVYRKGDRYFIPEGVVHGAEFRTRVFVMDVFADAGRYKTKA
ncbi:MAG: cupin domain-containing protein [Candidatus Aminicenantes bacterium]|nr:cupin domain-containing protein [Candidatus Aminicenantes bacterium]